MRFSLQFFPVDGERRNFLMRLLMVNPSPGIFLSLAAWRHGSEGCWPSTVAIHGLTECGAHTGWRRRSEGERVMILLPGLKPSGCRALQSVTELLQQPVGHVEANLSSKFAVLFFCRCRFSSERCVCNDRRRRSRRSALRLFPCASVTSLV